MKITLITQPSDPLTAAFHSRSLTEITYLPALTIEYLPLTVPPLTQYWAIALTSKNAVAALEQYVKTLKTLGNLRKDLQSLTFFCVGKATADKLQGVFKIGTMPEIRVGTGDAAELSLLIQEEYLKRGTDKNLFYLCGKDRLDTLPDAMKEMGIPCTELVVYSTVEVIFLTQPEETDWVCFFSPKGFEVIHESFRDNRWWRYVAAIGETTARAIRECGVVVDVVADAPRPENMARAIDEYGRTFD